MKGLRNKINILSGIVMLLSFIALIIEIVIIAISPLNFTIIKLGIYTFLILCIAFVLFGLSKKIPKETTEGSWIHDPY